MTDTDRPDWTVEQQRTWLMICIQLGMLANDASSKTIYAVGISRTYR